MQAALDVVAEQRAERLALAHAVEQPLGQPHPVRGQLDGEGGVVAPPWARWALRSSAAALAWFERGGVDEAGVVGRRRRAGRARPAAVGQRAPARLGRRFSTQP